LSLQSFFKDRPTNLVYLLLFTAVTRLPFLFRSFPTLPNHWLEDIYFPFIGSYNWVYVVVSFLLTFLNAFLVVLLMNTFNVGRNKTYLFGVLYILLTSYIGYETIFTSSLISDTAVLILLFELFKAHRNKNQYGNIFNIGFWLAAICILHFSNAIYFVFFLIAILALRKTTVKEFIIYLLGFAIPFYFMWMYLFINDSGHKRIVGGYFVRDFLV